MYSFEDIERHINPDLQGKLHRAQDAVAEKRNQISTLRDLIERAGSALNADRASLIVATETVSSAHKAVGVDPETMELKISEARKVKADLTAKVQEGEERIDDLSQGMGYAERELEELVKARDKARLHVLRGLKLAVDIPKSARDKVKIFDIHKLTMEDLLHLFFLHHEVAAGVVQPFQGMGGKPSHFFAFIAKFFADVSIEEAKMMRDRYNAMIWGDYDVPTAKARGAKVEPLGPYLNWNGQAGPR